MPLDLRCTEVLQAMSDMGRLARRPQFPRRYSTRDRQQPRWPRNQSLRVPVQTCGIAGSGQTQLDHLMGNNEMMLGVDGTLNIVPDHPAPSATCGHRASIGISQRYLLVLGLHHQGVQTVEALNLL